MKTYRKIATMLISVLAAGILTAADFEAPLALVKSAEVSVPTTTLIYDSTLSGDSKVRTVDNTITLSPSNIGATSYLATTNIAHYTVTNEVPEWARQSMAPTNGFIVGMSEVWTNDVAAVVTNNTTDYYFTDWTTGNVWNGDGINYFGSITNTGVSWFSVHNEWKMKWTGKYKRGDEEWVDYSWGVWKSCSNSVQEAVSLDCKEKGIVLTSQREKIKYVTRYNELGLAYYADTTNLVVNATNQVANTSDSKYLKKDGGAGTQSIGSYLASATLNLFGDLALQTGYSAPIRKITVNGNITAQGSAPASGNIVGNNIKTLNASFGDSSSSASNWSVAEGFQSTASGVLSHAAGYKAKANNVTAFVWQGTTNQNESTTTTVAYNDHGKGTFNLNPVDGLAGFWIGETNMEDHISNKISENPPESMPSTGLVYNASAAAGQRVRTKDGAKTIGAADVGALSVTGGVVSNDVELLNDDGYITESPYLKFSCLLSGTKFTSSIYATDLGFFFSKVYELPMKYRNDWSGVTRGFDNVTLQDDLNDINTAISSKFDNSKTNDLLSVAMSASETYTNSKTDYALTNFTGAAVEADAYPVTLQSGEIGNVTLGAGTNLAVTLTFPTANNRSCDCGILVINAADCVLDVGPSATVDVLGTEWGTIKAGTNLVYITRVKYADNKSVVSVTTKEVK